MMMDAHSKNGALMRQSLLAVIAAVAAAVLIGVFPYALDRTKALLVTTPARVATTSHPHRSESIFMHSTPAKPAPSFEHMLTGSRSDVYAIVLINKVPILQWFEPYRNPALPMSDVTSWIKPGDNELSVFLFWPPEKPQPTKKFLRLEIELVELYGDKQSTYPLLAWPDEEAPEVYPAYRGRTFRVDHPVPSTLWTDAQRLQMTPELRQSAVAYVANLHRVLTSGDVETLMKLSDYTNRHAARVQGAEPRWSEWIRWNREHWTEQLVDKRSTIAISDFDADELRVDLVGDDNIIMVTRHGNLPAIEIRNLDPVTKKPTGWVTPLQVSLASINGQLVWVR